MNDNAPSDGKGRFLCFESFGLLAGGLAHDYNNMLTAMLGGIDLILCDDIPDSVRDTANDIKAMMLKAATLVRRMLSCASGSEPQNERIDLNVLVRDIVRIMRRAIPDNAVVSIAPTVRLPYVYADTAMLWQVMMNLIINACDALERRDGIVTVTVVPRRLDSAALARFRSDAALEPGDYVEVSVADTGCGIDAALVDKIFDPLFTTKANGNGLGLPTTLAIVNACKGGIRVDSEKGQGTTFRVILPAMRDAAGAVVWPEAPAAAGTPPSPGVSPAASEVAAAPAPPSPLPAVPVPPADASVPSASARRRASGEKPTIMVVDDDTAIVKLLTLILGKAGYAVVTAYGGDEGLEVYRNHAGEIDLCLIDASMGAGMNGLDLCAAIRAASADIPLILMSAYRAKEMSERMAVSGVTTFLAKPFRGGEVVALCARYLGRAGA